MIVYCSNPSIVCIRQRFNDAQYRAENPYYENLIGTLMDFFHMLSMLIWTLRPACCAWEVMTEGGWHLGEQEGSTSFSPQLELKQVSIFFDLKSIMGVSYLPVILNTDLSGGMGLIKVSNMDTHPPFDIVITRGSCLHFLMLDVSRSLNSCCKPGLQAGALVVCCKPFERSLHRQLFKIRNLSCRFHFLHCQYSNACKIVPSVHDVFYTIARCTLLLLCWSVPCY